MTVRGTVRTTTGFSAEKRIPRTIKTALPQGVFISFILSPDTFPARTVLKKLFILPFGIKKTLMIIHKC